MKRLLISLSCAAFMLFSQVALAQPSKAMTKGLTERGLQNGSSGHVPCAARDITITNHRSRLAGASSWNATCNGDVYFCATIRSQTNSVFGAARHVQITCSLEESSDSGRNVTPVVLPSAAPAATSSVYDERRAVLVELCLADPATCDTVRLCAADVTEARTALTGEAAAAPPFDVCLPLYTCALIGGDDCMSQGASPSAAPPAAAAVQPAASEPVGSSAEPSDAVFEDDAAVERFCSSYVQYCRVARRCADDGSEGDCREIVEGRNAGLFEM